MMDTDDIFDELAGAAALWCASDVDDTDLAAMMEIAASRGITDVAVSPEQVKTVWPWLEKTPIKISARFYLPARDSGLVADDISDVSSQITTAFKYGADTAQVFMRCNDLAGFVKCIAPIRSDLFFNKKLSIGLDINEINPSDYGALFDALRACGANSLLLAFPRDVGNKSDFVGRLYGVLGAWDDAWRGDIHFVFGTNEPRIDQTMRLITAVQPKLANNMKFFIG